MSSRSLIITVIRTEQTFAHVIVHGYSVGNGAPYELASFPVNLRDDATTTERRRMRSDYSTWCHASGHVWLKCEPHREQVIEAILDLAAAGGSVRINIK